MIKDEQIPDEVVEAAARALAADAELNWDDVPYAHEVMRGEARAALIAGLAAWSGGEVVDWYHADKTLILPLPQEDS